jgi:uncharacterized protein (TIGR03663 family)
VEKAFAHWMEMHRIQRLGGPFYYYIPILLLYEIPILFFGILGLIHFLKKKDKNFTFYIFLSYWAVASLLLYSYLQEKVPWLVVHIVLPFGISAGAYLGEYFPPASRNRQEYQMLRKKKNNYTTGENSSPGKSRTHTFLAGILVFTVGIFLIQCVSVNFYRSMEPDELMTHTQASPDIRDLMKKIEGFSQGPETLGLYIADPDNLYWPLPWYLRDYERISYLRKPPLNVKYDAVIVPAEYQMYREIPKKEYSSYNFTLRPGKEFTLYYDKKLEK